MSAHVSIRTFAAGNVRAQSAALCPAAPNIERSVKDLQRCTASLTRYRMVVKEEMDSSIKTLKLTFAELQTWYVRILHTQRTLPTGDAQRNCLKMFEN